MNAQPAVPPPGRIARKMKPARVRTGTVRGSGPGPTKERGRVGPLSQDELDHNIRTRAVTPDSGLQPGESARRGLRLSAGGPCLRVPGRPCRLSAEPFRVPCGMSAPVPARIMWRRDYGGVQQAGGVLMTRIAARRLRVWGRPVPTREPRIRVSPITPPVGSCCAPARTARRLCCQRWSRARSSARGSCRWRHCRRRREVGPWE